jgi:hypothetical protein
MRSLEQLLRQPHTVASQWSSSGCSIACIFQLRGLVPQTGRTSSKVLKARVAPKLAESGAGDEVIMSIAGQVLRAMLSRYSHVRMEANRRALDEIVARQRAADAKAREEAERLPLFPTGVIRPRSISTWREGTSKLLKSRSRTSAKRCGVHTRTARRTSGAAIHSP